jgi:hypothetical protein
MEHPEAGRGNQRPGDESEGAFAAQQGSSGGSASQRESGLGPDDPVESHFVLFSWRKLVGEALH